MKQYGNKREVMLLKNKEYKALALVSFLLLAMTFASLPARAEGPARPVGYYVDAALSGNPSLGSMSQRIEMKRNEALRAGALDDPKLWFALSNVPTGSWSLREEDMTGKEIGLSQMLPYPGKRDRAVQMAAREKEQAEFELAEIRNMLRADVKMAYAELSTVRAQAELVRRTRAILEQVVEVSREMFAVGKGRQPDVLRGQIEYQKMREMLLTRENREKVLSIRLNTLSALPPGEPVPAIDNLLELPVSLDARALREIYLAERPARRAVQARIGKGEIGILQADSGHQPDFEVSASYMQREAMPDGTGRSDLVSAMVSMTLPVWGKGKIDPGIRAMTAEREMAVRDLETLDNEAANTIEGGLSSLGNFAAVAKLYRTTLIPQAEQAVLSNLEAYRVGKVDFPMLMDSLMAELAFRRDYIGMVGEMHMAKARLEAAVGKELDGAAPAPGGEGR